SGFKTSRQSSRRAAALRFDQGLAPAPRSVYTVRVVAAVMAVGNGSPGRNRIDRGGFYRAHRAPSTVRLSFSRGSPRRVREWFLVVGALLPSPQRGEGRRTARIHARLPDPRAFSALAFAPPYAIMRPFLAAYRSPTPLHLKGHPMATPSVEVVFSFDTTGSMYPCLTQVRRKIKETVNRLAKEVPGIRIGIIAHGDYCDKGTTYVTKHLELTSKTADICKFVETVKPTYGGDAPECYELVLHEAQSLDWSKDATKAMVLIGDDVPHG